MKPQRIFQLQRKTIILSIFSIVWLVLPAVAFAQCSMCRAVTGSSQFSEDTFIPGRGLNDAILYLMAMPYIMAAVFVFAFFRKPMIAWFRSSRSSA